MANNKALTKIRKLYDRWNEELLRLGFTLTDDAEQIMSTKNKLQYKYEGHFSVHGDHAYDYFGVFAVMTEEGLFIVYESSRLTEVFLQEGGAVDIDERDARIELVVRYMNKRRHLLNQVRPEDIILHPNGEFTIQVEDSRSPERCLGAFEKLAVLLDLELARTFPFYSIREYEIVYKISLGLFNDILDNFVPGETVNSERFNKEYLNPYQLMKLLLLSKYGISRQDAVKELKALASKVKKCSDLQQLYDLENADSGSGSQPLEDEYEPLMDEEYFASAIETFENMPDDVFCMYKDKLFDL